MLNGTDDRGRYSRFPPQRRARSRKLPIVYGGWHPSLLPGETLNEDFVDVVVRGQGELTLVELATALADGRSPVDISGLS